MSRDGLYSKNLSTGETKRTSKRVSREVILDTLTKEKRFDKAFTEERKKRRRRLKIQRNLSASKINRENPFTFSSSDAQPNQGKYDYKIELHRDNPYDRLQANARTPSASIEISNYKPDKTDPHHLEEDWQTDIYLQSQQQLQDKRPGTTSHQTASLQKGKRTESREVVTSNRLLFEKGKRAENRETIISQGKAESREVVTSNRLLFEKEKRSNPFVTNKNQKTASHTSPQKNQSTFAGGMSYQLKSQIINQFAKANQDQNIGMKTIVDSVKTVDSTMEIKKLFFKKQLKKRMIKAAAQKEAARLTASQGLKVILSQAKKAVTSAAIKATAAGAPVLVIILIIAMLFAIIGGCGSPNLAVILAAYPAEDKDIHDASLYVTELEANLQKEILDIESSPRWLGIDEFTYQPSLSQMLNNIEHNPFEMMAYLSAMYEDFKFSVVKDVISRIHEERYSLLYNVEVQVREREDENGQIEYYEWKILHTSLRSVTLSEVIMPELEADPDKKEMYDIYMELKGLHQTVANPFNYDWTGGISSIYGYRIDPIAGSDIQIHRGVDIPNPTGTPIVAGFNGSVVETGYNDIFGNYIVIADTQNKYQVKYAHCDTISLSQGDTIRRGKTVLGTVGNTGASTGSHVHIEVKYKGEYLNPVFMVDYSAKPLSRS